MGLANIYNEKLAHELWSEQRKRLTNTNIAVVGNNCVAGILAKDLGLRFMSPTVDSMIAAEPYLRFCEDIPYYANQPLLDGGFTPKEHYVIGLAGDIPFIFMHDATFAEAQIKWERRRQRLKDATIVLCFSAGADVSTEERERFARLPYERKILYLSTATELGPFEFLIEDESIWSKPSTLLNRVDGSCLRYFQQMDVVEWLTQGQIMPFKPRITSAMKRHALFATAQSIPRLIH